MLDAEERTDKSNPKITASLFSQFSFWWVTDLVKKTCQKQLGPSDLYDVLSSCNSETLGDELEKNWKRELQGLLLKGAKPSLLRAILHTFGWSLVLGNSLLVFSHCVLRMFVPYCVGLLIDAIDHGKKTSTQCLWCTAGIIIFNFLWILPVHHGTFMSKITGLKIHAACSSLIYRKALRLGANTSPGPLVNLMSNDLSRFEQVASFISSLVILPLQMVVGVSLMWQQVGVSSLAGVFSMSLLVIPMQFLVGRCTMKQCMKKGARTDERVRLMAEIISSIRVIKMHAWEVPFEKMVTSVRRMEMLTVNKLQSLHGYWIFSLLLTNYLPLFVIVTCYVLLGNHVTAAQIFTTDVYLSLLNLVLSYMFPVAVHGLAAIRISILRLESFLLREEGVILQDTSGGTKQLQAEIGVKIHKACAKWCTMDTISSVLCDITLDVVPGRLCAVVGPVGSGKSSLFQAILGEIPLTSGTIAVGGDVSYASQEPWLFMGTIRQNILFGQPYEPSRYWEVVRVCALQRDFQLFLNGDMTTVGERGVSLSGGQRARISLARAVYRAANVYLLDDTLSAVDVHVGKHILNECFVSFLQGKTRLIITHQEQVLKEADMIVFMSNGRVQHIGTYEDLYSDGLKYSALSQATAVNSGMVQRNSGADEICDTPFKEAENLGAVDDENPEPEPDEQAELIPKRALGASVFWRYLRAGGSTFTIAFTLLMFLLSQAVGNTFAFWLRDWCLQDHFKNASTSLPVELSMSSSSTDEDVYALPVLMETNHSAGLSSSHYLWNGELSMETSLIVYVSLMLIFCVFTIVRTFLFLHMSSCASTALHDSTFHTVMWAVIKFFDNNPSGRVLNRFSKDMGTVDEILPQKILLLIQVLLVMMGAVITIAVVNYLCVVPMLLLGLFTYGTSRVYLRTGQSIKLLEAATYSPVFSHVSATLNGVTTVRAYRKQDMLSKQFHSHQDVNTSAIYLSLALEQAFALWMDVAVSLYVAVIVISFLFFGESDAGTVALAIVQALQLMSRLQFATCSFSDVCTHMTSAQRLLEYLDIPKEDDLQSKTEHKPERNWPSEGAVDFNHVSVRYSSSDPPVLNDINLSLAPGEKVGIVGRTGAGKSSLAAGLFRLAQLEGSIKIDKVDIQSVGLSDLRSRISIIPQEPVLFTTSLRNNLDPLHNHEDADLWRALQEVELGMLVTSLETLIAAGGSNLSSGQRQLICLARAILRNNKILIMDEATANVDPQTDALIQATIKKKFKDCTVLTIAHRLNTILDSDRVLVLDAGTLVECGDPRTLLQNPEGYLYKMVAEQSEKVKLTENVT